MDPSTHASGDHITYGTVYLHPFDVDAPTITTVDGAVYVSMRWLCELLGLAPARWIGLLCAWYRGYPDRREEIPLVRRLPRQQTDGAIHDAWCLEWNQVVRLLSFTLPTRYVPPGPRRDQLKALRDQMFEAVTSAYDHQQSEFHAAKRALIQQLQGVEQAIGTLERLQTSLGPHIEHSAPTLAEGRANRVAFAEVIEEGRKRQLAYADALRVSLQKITDTPVVDAFEVNEEGTVVDTTAMPILPVTPDMSEINGRADAALAWFTNDLTVWLRAHGFDASFTPRSPSSDTESG